MHWSRDAARVLFVGVVLAVSIVTPLEVSAQPSCSKAVVFTLPATTWDDVEATGDDVLGEMAAEGAVGSVSVRTNASRTTHPSGFATIGGGTRLDATQTAAQISGSGVRPVLPNLSLIAEAAAEAGYSTARPGAMAEALRTEGIGVRAVGTSDLGAEPATPVGRSEYAALAATDAQGNVVQGPAVLRSEPDAPYAIASDPEALLDGTKSALDDCDVVVVDPGDLVRADMASVPDGGRAGRVVALESALRVLREVRSLLDPGRDLLLVVSPSSPLSEGDVHFGVAAAVGPTFEPGTTLESPSTRRAGIVTLPDVAPTVLAHLGVERPASMLGRAWVSRPVEGDPIEAAGELDDESVFIDRIRTPVSTVFVLLQVLLYAVTVWILRHRDPARGRGRAALQAAALLLAAFPLAAFLGGVVDGHELGAVLYPALLVAIAMVVVLVAMSVRSDPLERLLVVTGATLAILLVDLVVGAPLQLNTVFSYSPIVAGRFAGIGNIGFAILTATSLLTGALIVHVWGRRPLVLLGVAAVFALTIVIDGAPQFGSDVGGAIALVPGLAIAWVLLAGRKPSLRTVLLVLVGAVAVLALFLAIDLARPEDQRTHLARLFEDVRSGGGTVFADTIKRKVRTNLRVFRSTIWTFVVPPALAVLAWLLFFPRGRWERLRQSHPVVVAGLIGGVVLAVLGYAVNDSGIVIPAMMCAYLVPIGLLAHMSSPDAPQGAGP